MLLVSDFLPPPQKCRLLAYLNLCFEKSKKLEAQAGALLELAVTEHIRCATEELRNARRAAFAAEFMMFASFHYIGLAEVSLFAIMFSIGCNGKHALCRKYLM